MSILIRGMEMPTKENFVILINPQGGVWMIGDIPNEDTYLVKANAVSVPPHGRLIDADALVEFIKTLYDATWDEGYAGACVDNLERITTSISIPAEESENKE